MSESSKRGQEEALEDKRPASAVEARRRRQKFPGLSRFAPPDMETRHCFPCPLSCPAPQRPPHIHPVPVPVHPARRRPRALLYTPFATSGYTSNRRCVVTGIPARASSNTFGSVRVLSVHRSKAPRVGLTNVHVNYIFVVFRLRKHLAPMCGSSAFERALIALRHLHRVDDHRVSPLHG